MKKLKHTPTVYAIGECMVEFSHLQGEDYSRSFAGDVYNTAVYLKRLAPKNCNIEFVTAIGDDPMSTAMLSAWRNEGVATNHVAILPGQSPGLYVIETDETGERTFSYWRNQSAARALTASLEHMDHVNFQNGDYIYFSGITLAILNNDRRRFLFDFVQRAKTAGAEIAFDPNFRPTLWETNTAAEETIETAYYLADIVLTGADDEASLFSRDSEALVHAALSKHDVKEAILKAGPRGIFGVDGGIEYHIPFTPAQDVVDTTAAGDSFAGAYLAFRLHGKESREAASLAANLARIVVSSRGAIVDRPQMQQQVSKDPFLKRALEITSPF